jgi:hypothetical protein
MSAAREVRLCAGDADPIVTIRVNPKFAFAEFRTVEVSRATCDAAHHDVLAYRKRRVVPFKDWRARYFSARFGSGVAVRIRHVAH